MKKLIIIAGALICLLNTGMLCNAESKILLYAYDGRTIQIPVSELGDYLKVGWHTSPFVTMYAPGGRTIRVNKSEIEAYKNVGWFKEPMVTLYALDGRTIEVGGEEVQAYKNVGWYSKEDADKIAGQELDVVLVQFDYLEVYKNFIKSKGDNWQCSPPADVPPFYDGIALGNGNFEDAYAIDIDNDDYPELVALFSNEEYGRAVIYKCENGDVYEWFSTAGYGGGSGMGWISQIVQKKSKNYIYEAYYYETYAPDIQYYEGKLTDNGYTTEIASEEFTNKYEWSVFKVNGNTVTQEEFEKEHSRISSIIGYEAITLINIDDYDTYDIDNCDRLKGQNLQKFCISSMIEKTKRATATANVQELILAAFKTYQYGYYYEAIQICDKIKARNDITEQQLSEINDIISYCNNNLAGETQKKIEYISELMMSGDYYGAYAIIGECKKSICSDSQLEVLAKFEEECKYKIYAYESEMEEYLTIYAKSGMSLYIQKKELDGYLSSGVWFKTPQKYYSDMKRDAYQYAKNLISNRLYYPKSAYYPGVNNDEIYFWLDSQEGSQAVYKVEGWVEANNTWGYKVRNYYTATLYCNPYGFYTGSVEFD